MPIKRLHYFNNQFLDASDFTDEQDYHLETRRAHNRLLHTWGVADGFDVTFSQGASTVQVGPGTAIDGQGREIVLETEETVELADHPANGDVYVAIRYREQESDPTEETGAAGNTRWTEEPEIEHTDSRPAATGARVLLAKVSRSGTKVNAVDQSDRRAAGVVAGSIEVRELVLTDPGIAASSWARARLAAAKRAEVAGSLSITEAVTAAGKAAVGTADTALGRLTIEDAAVPLVFRETGQGLGAGGLWRAALDGGMLRFDVSTGGAGNFSGFHTPLAMSAAGNVGMGTTAPMRRLHVENSELHSGGPGGGLSFANRESGFVEGGGAGDRWVWFASQGIARLWSAGDRLTLRADNGRLTVPGGAVLGNTFLGDVGHGAGWAGFSHSSVPNPQWYGLLQSNDGRWTLVNKRSGGGAIEFRIDNVTRLGMGDDGAFYVDLADGNVGGSLANALRFGAWGTGEGIASKRTAGDGRWGLDFYAGGFNRMQIRNDGHVNIGGILGTGGKDPVAGLPTGWGGGLHTWDVYAEATVAAGPAGGPAKAWINSAGEVRGSSKSFVIDHPLDETKSLVHAAIEAPELGVYYRGEARLEGGTATIELPIYFEKLTRKQNRTVLLTPRLHAGAPIVPLAASAVEGGKFTVRIGEGGNPRQRFYWEVKAVRADLPQLEIEPDRLV